MHNDAVTLSAFYLVTQPPVEFGGDSYRYSNHLLFFFVIQTIRFQRLVIQEILNNDMSGRGNMTPITRTMTRSRYLRLIARGRDRTIRPRTIRPN